MTLTDAALLFWRQSNNSSSTGLPDAAPQDSYSIQDTRLTDSADLRLVGWTVY
jgi:hypothetical protein